MLSFVGWRQGTRPLPPSSVQSLSSFINGPPLFRSLTPQDEARVAVVSGPGSVDVGTLEVGHLDEAVLGRLRVVALHFWKKQREMVPFESKIWFSVVGFCLLWFIRVLVWIVWCICFGVAQHQISSWLRLAGLGKMLSLVRYLNTQDTSTETVIC